ncbi:MAG: MFS transporter [Candidatus Limnocylindrales bacterium]
MGVRFVGLLSLASLGLWAAFFTPIQELLPEQLEAIDPVNKVFWLSVVTGVGALIAVVANPLAGALSDRTTLRFGRRHPWTLGCAIAGALALVALSQASAVWLVLVGWCLAQASLNGMLASLTAMVPDQVPVKQRGEVSAWVGIPGPVGLVVGVALVTAVVSGIVAGYAVIAVLVLAAAIPLVLLVHDESLPREFRPALSWRSFLAGFWIDPRAHPDFGWAWLTRFLVSLGNSLGTLYLLYFPKDAVHYEQRYGGSAEDALLVLILIYTACLLVTAIGGGIWSDRVGRRKAFVMIATGIMAAGAVILALFQTWEAAIVAAAVMGAGYGTYLAVDQALITQVLPAAGSRARDLGVINIANSLPQVLGPAMAGPVIAGLGGYPSLYWLTALVTLMGAILVQPIRSVR